MYTPGPWKKVPNFLNNKIWAIMSGDVMVVAEATENDDDANLIAAAPELLEALEALLNPDNFDDDGDLLIGWTEDEDGNRADNPLITKAHAAIKRAKGEAV